MNRILPTHPGIRASAVGLCCVAFLAMLGGCNDGRPTRVPVSGQVTIDGAPLQGGAIRFTPESGRPSTGSLDEEGRFSLFTFEPNDGCTLGKHRVSVIVFQDISSTVRQFNAPKKYLSPDTSGLTQEISEPTNGVKIELTWGGQKGPFTEKNFIGE